MNTYKQALKLYLSPAPGQKKNGIKDDNKTSKNIKNKPIDTSKYTELELYFELQRKENEAAKIIQRVWRKVLALRPWRWAIKAMMAIVAIQRRARGMIARKWVARWFKVRTAFATNIQSRCRRHMTNKRMRPKLAFEKRMAIAIQCIVRGFLSRRRARFILRDLCATRIQALWRGCVDRSRADRFWLTKTVLKIQNATRRTLAMKKFKGEQVRLYNAALIIQRRFRLYLAAQRVANSLHEREMDYRMECIGALMNQEEMCQTRLARLLDRVVKNQTKEKAVELQIKLQQFEEDIQISENAVKEIERQLEILSPRAIRQGFRKDLRLTVNKQRNELTQKKLTYLFENSFQSQVADAEYEAVVEEVESIAMLKNRLAIWRTDEYDERRHLNYQRDVNARRKIKSQAIAEERRKWQVRYYSSSGKPDKKRRPGRPWDKSLIAGAEKMTYSSAVGVDLLAFVNQKEVKIDDYQDPVKKAENAIKNVTLQTYLDQVKVYEQLLNPIQTILQRNLGLAEGVPSLDKTGWGEEGPKLTEALLQTGVERIPEPIQPPLKYVLRDKRQNKSKVVSLVNPSHTKTKKASTQRHSVVAAALEPEPGSINKPCSLSMSYSESLSGTIPTRNESQRHVQFKEVPSDGEKVMDSDEGQHKQDDDDVEELLTPADLLEHSVLKRYHRKPPKQYMPTEESFQAHYSYLGQRSNNSGTRRNLIPIENETAPEQAKKTLKRQPSVVMSSSMSSLPAASSSLESITSVEIERDRKAKLEKELSLRMHESRRAKKITARKVGIIPWDKLDEADGARHRFESERSYVEFHHKIGSALDQITNPL